MVKIVKQYKFIHKRSINMSFSSLILISNGSKSLMKFIILAISSISLFAHATGIPLPLQNISGSNEQTIVVDNVHSGIVHYKASDFIVNGVTSIINASATPAKLIIIEARGVSFESKLRVLGNTADIVVITNGSGNSISCYDCEFENVGRLTFSTANFIDKGFSKGNIGTLNVDPRGSVVINNLKGPGLQSLEVITSDLDSSGNIDINSRAFSHPEGGFIFHENGGKVIGSGGINYFVGDFNINYETLKVESKNRHGGMPRISGSYSALSMSILSDKNIDIGINTVFSTKNDAVTTSTRNGTVFVPIEGVYIQQIGSGSKVNFLGSIESDGTVSIKSSGEINGRGNILSSKLLLIAKDKIFNKGIIESNEIKLSSDDFINNGVIQAKRVEIDTLGNIQNQFGGIINATDLNLKSRNGRFINGARTSTNNLSVSTLSRAPSTDISSLEIGLYYDTSMSFSSCNKDCEAKIFSENIAIEAKSIENINPYWLSRPPSNKWDSSITVNNDLANQVSIQAGNSMKLKAEEYILNSSSVLGVEGSGGFIVNSPIFSNERYRLAMSNYIYNKLIVDPEKPKSFDTADVGTVSKIVKYSPPGRIYSFSDVKVSGPENSNFINEVSYTEIYGDLNLKNMALNSIGLELNKSISESQLHKVKTCFIDMKCSGKNSETSMESETLLAISGKVKGVNDEPQSLSSLNIDNINVYDIKTRQLVKDYLDSLIYDHGNLNLAEVDNVSIDAGSVRGVRRVCKPKYVGWGVGIRPACKLSNFSVSINKLLEDDAVGRVVGDTGITHGEFIAAGKKYVSSLAPNKVIWNSSLEKVFNSVSSDLDYASYAIDGCYVVVSYIQHNKFKGYNHVGFSHTIDENYSKRISIKSLVSLIYKKYNNPSCNKPVEIRAEDISAIDALASAKSYVSSLPIDASLWSKAFAQAYSSGKVGSLNVKMTYSLEYISYRVKNGKFEINYKQKGKYTGFAYVTFSREEEHEVTKVLTPSELLEFRPY